MDIKTTSSVSKGVFVFKNGIKASSNRRKNRKCEKTNVFYNNLWYQTYATLWDNLEKELEKLNNEMFSSVLLNLVSYAQSAYNNKVDEIPSAALLTGINMPDHGVQFKTLANQIKQQVSPHVACLYSQDCQNLKYLVENMINQFVNFGGDSDSENEAMDTDDNPHHLKKSQFNFLLLQAWYENLYPPKKTKETGMVPLVVIIPDFESFNSTVLQNFIQIVRSYINILPIVLIFGVATSVATLHASLPYHITSKISIQIFHSQPSTVFLNNVLEKIFLTANCPFQLGGRVLNLFTDIFLFYDLSVSGFVKNIKYAMMEHFCYGNAKALCRASHNEVKDVLNLFSHEDFENVRQLLSFRTLIEKESNENKIKLLTNDDHFRIRLEEEIYKFKKYIRRFHIFIKCLHILVHDLPKAPLGKQIRELYSIAASKNVTMTAEFKECIQMLNFQSKEELCDKVNKINEFIQTKRGLKEFRPQLEFYLNNLNTVDLDDSTEAVKICDKTELILDQLDRRQLKEKLLSMSKQNKCLNKYEKMRSELLIFLSKTFEENLLDPKSFYFHEIYFFNNISIQHQIIGAHRSAIHNALNDPQYYLQCKCCNIPNDSSIKISMPDISIAYKLHLECGKMINLYDWLQAFLSIVDPTEVDDESKRIVDPELQARFTQAVAELEFLGFIKSSKRKVDHVTRLTWGG